MNYKIHRLEESFDSCSPALSIQPRCSSREQTRRPCLNKAILTRFAAAGTRHMKVGRWSAPIEESGADRLIKEEPQNKSKPYHSH